MFYQIIIKYKGHRSIQKRNNIKNNVTIIITKKMLNSKNIISYRNNINKLITNIYRNS